MRSKKTHVEKKRLRGEVRRGDERKYIGGRRGRRDGQLRMEGRTGVRQSERVVFKGRKTKILSFMLCQWWQSSVEHGLSRIYLWKSNSIKLYFFLQCEGSCRPRLGIGKYVSKPGLTILRKKSVRNSKLFSKWVTGTFDNGGAAVRACAGNADATAKGCSERQTRTHVLIKMKSRTATSLCLR